MSVDRSQMMRVCHFEQTATGTWHALLSTPDGTPLGLWGEAATKAEALHRAAIRLLDQLRRTGRGGELRIVDAAQRELWPVEMI